MGSFFDIAETPDWLCPATHPADTEITVPIAVRHEHGGALSGKGKLNLFGVKDHCNVPFPMGALVDKGQFETSGINDLALSGVAGYGSEYTGPHVEPAKDDELFGFVLYIASDDFVPEKLPEEHHDHTLPIENVGPNAEQVGPPWRHEDHLDECNPVIIDLPSDDKNRPFFYWDEAATHVQDELKTRIVSAEEATEWLKHGSHGGGMLAKWLFTPEIEVMVPVSDQTMNHKDPDNVTPGSLQRKGLKIDALLEHPAVLVPDEYQKTMYGFALVCKPPGLAAKQHCIESAAADQFVPELPEPLPPVPVSSGTNFFFKRVQGALVLPRAEIT